MLLVCPDTCVRCVAPSAGSYRTHTSSIPVITVYTSSVHWCIHVFKRHHYKPWTTVPHQI